MIVIAFMFICAAGLCYAIYSSFFLSKIVPKKEPKKILLQKKVRNQPIIKLKQKEENKHLDFDDALMLSASSEEDFYI